MVKKIGGGRPPLGPAAGPIEGGKPVEATKVGSVGKIRGLEKQEGTERSRRVTRPMTAAEREELHRMIQEEADRMFESGEIPKGKRKTVETAVRMAIDGSILEETEKLPPRKC